MCQFPRVVTFQISFPLQEILQLLSSPMTLVVPDGLDFVLFFPSDKIGWWSQKVWTMRFRLLVGR